MATTAGVALSYISWGSLVWGTSSAGSHAGEEPASMDSIVLIMFGSVLCTMTALNFMELRKIRKKLETKQP